MTRLSGTVTVKSCVLRRVRVRIRVRVLYGRTEHGGEHDG